MRAKTLNSIVCITKNIMMQNTCAETNFVALLLLLTFAHLKLFSNIVVIFCACQKYTLPIFLCTASLSTPQFEYRGVFMKLNRPASQLKMKPYCPRL